MCVPRLIPRHEPKVPRVFRFTIREMMWLTLVVAIATGWWAESFRTRQWRQRAEIAAGQLEAENLGQMVFQNKGVSFKSLYYDAPLRQSFIPTDSEL
jgi:hypothetical protein